ncbi:Isoflavone 2'-hydroxylase [Acorus calamus]|uniref:Isoflavone 2'-hydroxylase n=1 Tax=Acorus calamus TaxID=4465 RepID=A0AAV9EUN4_ACOCL|nr:Isoflavone 2'-hydroxylase [Acorus calamus]
MDDLIFYLALFLTIILLSRLLLSPPPKHPSTKPPPPPSPPSLPLIGHLHLFKKPLHRTLSALSLKYGPVLSLRFGTRPVLVVSSSSAAEECFTKNDIAFANRPRFLSAKILGYNYTVQGAAPYGDHWRNIRRFTTVGVFSTARVNSFSPIRSAEVRSIVKSFFSSRSIDGGFTKVELKSVFFDLAFNVVMEMISGKKFHGEGATGSHEEVEEFREIVEESFRFAGASNLGDFMPILNWVMGLEKRLLRLHKRRDAFFEKLIEEHRLKRKSGDVSEGVEKRETIIDVMLTLQESDAEYYTDTIIKGVIASLLTAGTDTTAVTTEWALSHLLNNPETLKKAKDEIDMVVGHDHMLEESSLPKLPYLHDIISETLRLCPAGPLLVPHESREECTVGGYYVPPETMLLVNAWAIHRDPSLWEEPTNFKPERFQGGAAEGYKMIPFGSGRRRCPGEGLAMRLLGLTLGTLIQCFEWKRIGEEEVDMMEGPGLTMPKDKPLEAMYRPWPSMIDVLSQL